MSHTIELSDEQYAAVMRAVAARPGATLESLVAEWAAGIDPSEPDHYYTDEQFLRVLGADDAEIEAFNQRLAREAAGDTGANVCLGPAIHQ